MSDLTKNDVIKALAAAEFAAAFLLNLDVLMTLDLAGMGFSEPTAARNELQRFLKAMNSWLTERKLPVAWIACIERAKAGNLHAHIAVHVPGMRRAEGKLHGVRYRTHFRRWAREAIARRVGAAVPGLVNVRCSLVPSVISHWVSVTYLLKGYDRGAVLVDGRNSQDGAELRLGDILPFPYRDAGDTGLDRRLFISGNLGPARRSLGAPTGAEFMLPPKPDLHALQLVPGGCAPPQTQAVRSCEARPFRAAVEDGLFDVRRIYGAEFAGFVTAITPAEPLPAEPGPSYNPDLLTFLHDLDI